MGSSASKTEASTPAPGSASDQKSIVEMKQVLEAMSAKYTNVNFANVISQLSAIEADMKQNDITTLPGPPQSIPIQPPLTLSGGAVKNKTIYILGRIRKLTREGNKYMLVYHGKKYTLTQARMLDKKLKRKQ